MFVNSKLINDLFITKPVIIDLIILAYYTDEANIADEFDPKKSGQYIH